MQKQTPLHIQSTITVTDVALWEAIIMGDEASFAQFVKKYSTPLFNYGYRLCKDRDFLKDGIQDLFLELWDRRKKIIATDQLKWYLFKSLRNNIFHEQAKLARNQCLMDDYDFTVEFDIEHDQIVSDTEKALTTKVKRTLEHLPPRQKEVLYLRYFERLAFDDIAEIMDISKQSAHNLLQKSYKTFREKWSIVGNPAMAT